MCSYLKSFSTLKTLSSLFYSLSSFCLFFSMLTQRSYCLSILGRQSYITTLSWLKAHCITLSAFSTCCIIKAYTNVISIWLLVIIDFISLLAPSQSAQQQILVSWTSWILMSLLSNDREKHQ